MLLLEWEEGKDAQIAAMADSNNTCLAWLGLNRALPYGLSGWAGTLRP